MDPKVKDGEYGHLTNKFGKVLTTVRKERGLTQHELSDSSGISLRMISDMERGITQPSLITLFKLANGLKMPPTALLEILLKYPEN